MSPGGQEYDRFCQSNDAVVVAVKADINAAVIERYDNGCLHFILSATTSGGFSGAPVIDQRDRLIAIITESLIRADEAVETAFSAAISVDPLIELLLQHRILRGSSSAWMSDLLPKS
jgi:hypothetical protein